MKPTELMFSNCTLAILEDWFELRLQVSYQTLDNWLNSAQNITTSVFEKEMVAMIANDLHKGPEHWNETDFIYALYWSYVFGGTIYRRVSI